MDAKLLDVSIVLVEGRRKRLNVDCHDRMCKIVVELLAMINQVQMLVATKDHCFLKFVVVPNWTASR